MPMPRRSTGTFTPAAASNSASPCTAMRPSSGVSRPAMERKVVVLPQPEGPSMAKNAPGSSAKLTSRTPPASRSVGFAKIFVRRSTWSMAASAIRQHDERVERNAAAPPRQERIDVDLFDACAGVEDEARERDQRRDDRVAIEGRPAAISVEQRPYLRAADQGARRARVERRRRQRHVAAELDVDAAGAEQDDRAHLGIARRAEDELEAVGDLFGDQHSVERRAALSHGANDLPVGGAQRLVGVDPDDHAAAVGFVCQRGAHRLGDHPIADPPRHGDGLARIAGDRFARRADAVGPEQRFRSDLGQYPGYGLPPEYPFQLPFRATLSD